MDRLPVELLRLNDPGLRVGSHHAAASRNVLVAAWRRRGLLLGLAVLFVGGAAAAMALLDRQYTAEAILQLNLDKREDGAVDDRGSQVALDAGSIVQGELKIIRSRLIAQRVVERLHLADGPGAGVPGTGAAGAAARPAREAEPGRESAAAATSGEAAPGSPGVGAGGAVAGAGAAGAGVGGTPAARPWVPAAEAVLLGWVDGARGALRSAEGGAASWRTELPPVTTKRTDPGARRTEAAENELLSHLTVETDNRSYIITIRTVSADPERSAQIANAVAEEYIKRRLEANFDAAGKIVGWFDGQIGSATDQLRQAEGAVEAYRLQAGLLELGTSENLQQQQLRILSAQLSNATAARGDAESRLGRVRELLHGNGMASAADLRESPQIQSLQERQASARKQLTTLMATLGARHPLAVQAQAELDGVNASLGEEMRRAVSILQGDAAAAQALERDLTQRLAAAQHNIIAGKSGEAELRTEQAAVQAARDRLTSLTRNRDQALAAQQLRFVAVSLIVPAEAPGRPSFPRATVVYPLALAGALGAWLVLAALLARRDRGFVSSNEIEPALGVRCVGMIPQAPSREDGGGAHGLKHALMAEGVRSVAAALGLFATSRACRVVLVTSSVRGEGKSAFCRALADALAASGQRVLLMDGSPRSERVAPDVQVGVAAVTAAARAPSGLMERWAARQGAERDVEDVDLEHGELEHGLEHGAMEHGAMEHGGAERAGLEQLAAELASLRHAGAGPGAAQDAAASAARRAPDPRGTWRTGTDAARRGSGLGGMGHGVRRGGVRRGGTGDDGLGDDGAGDDGDDADADADAGAGADAGADAGAGGARPGEDGAEWGGAGWRPTAAMRRAAKGLPTRDVFGTGELARLLDNAHGDFDTILLEGPPVLLVGDSLVLGRMADTVIHVAQWAGTRQKTIGVALNRLHEASVRVDGVVLTGVDLRRHAAMRLVDQCSHYLKDRAYYELLYGYGRYRRGKGGRAARADVKPAFGS